jgi:amino acid permease
MASQTLGPTGTKLTSAAYAFLHYSLLIAYISKAGEITSGALHVPLPAGEALFAGAFAAGCYATSPKLLDQINGALVVLVVGSFVVSRAALPSARCCRVRRKCAAAGGTLRGGLAALAAQPLGALLPGG